MPLGQETCRFALHSSLHVGGLRGTFVCLVLHCAVYNAADDYISDGLDKLEEGLVSVRLFFVPNSAIHL